MQRGPNRTSERASTLQLPLALREHLEVWAQKCYPNEACGLLLGRRDGERTQVVAVREARNLEARARTNYELHPADHLAAEDAARREGLEVVGIWHTHPDRPARPSETDRLHAWGGWTYAILSVDANGAFELRAWRLERQRFVEEEMLP